jgi:hypothetical protein
MLRNSVTSGLEVLEKKSIDIQNTDIQNTDVNKNLLFTVLSAGFNNGDFAEFSLGQNVFISKKESKRGITVLCLTPNITKCHSWNFDFYNIQTKITTNSNFILLLKKIPSNTYFAMSIKDDAYQNLFDGTKHFLTKTIGCKLIWKLNYRNSWCVIVYKKTENSFNVISEAYNPSGVAKVKHLILNPFNLPETEKNLPLSIFNTLAEYSDKENTTISVTPYNKESNSIIEDIDIENSSLDTENDEFNLSSQNILNNITSVVKELKLIILKQTNVVNKLNNEVKELKNVLNNVLNNVFNNDVNNEVDNEDQELKELVQDLKNVLNNKVDNKVNNKNQELKGLVQDLKNILDNKVDNEDNLLDNKVDNKDNEDNLLDNEDNEDNLLDNKDNLLDNKDNKDNKDNEDNKVDN